MKIIDEDLTGREFGRLTAKERDKDYRDRWICECSCEKKTMRSFWLYDLHRGKVKSCGCISRENAYNTKHGLSHSPLYKTWIGIKTRCFDKNKKRYKDYGGRGITLYAEWVNNAKAFIDYVSKLQNYGKENFTLDRINNDGNYEPGNLRWASKSQQVQNTRYSVFSEEDILEIRRLLKTKTTREICDIFNVHISYIRNIKNNISWKNIQLEDEG